MRPILTILAGSLMVSCTAIHRTEPERDDLISIELEAGVSAMDVLRMFTRIGRTPLDRGGLSREELSEVHIPACKVTDTPWKEALPMVLSKAGLSLEFVDRGGIVLWKVTRSK